MARRRVGGELLGFDERVNGGERVLGGLDELDAAAIEDRAFLQLADLAVRDAPLDDDRALPSDRRNSCSESRCSGNLVSTSAPRSLKSRIVIGS